MALDMSGVSNGLLKIFSSLLFWGALLLVLFILTLGFLIIRKKKKLIYPLIVLTDLGAGKIGAKIKTKHGAGWFKKKTAFFGLFDYGGEDILKTWDKREVQNASSEDFHDINGVRGLICVRKSDDPSILLPLNKVGTSNNYKIKDNSGDLEAIVPVKAMRITNIELLNMIAPADYRDASSKILDADNKETMSKWEKIAPILVLSGLMIITLICIIFIVQMVNNSQTKSWENTLKSQEMILSNDINTQPSGAP
jgi:hypothetical protein